MSSTAAVAPETTAAARRERDRLINEHVGMAQRIARKVARRTPGRLEDDLVSAALVGLTEAAARYDGSRGEPFVAFAAPRIRGAVIDELRRGDILPRRVRSAANRHAQAVTRLEHTLGRSPEAAEIAGELGVSVKVVREEYSRSAHVCMVSMADATSSRELVHGGDLASTQLERAQLIQLVRSALDRLAERDALVLSLYYVESLSYQEVGEIMGVSESRVCQLCKRALSRLREILRLGDDDVEF